MRGVDRSQEPGRRHSRRAQATGAVRQWAVEGVLLSSDLLPHLLAPLQLQDGAAAAVCSRWADGWKATSEGRRRLTRVAFDFPQDLLGKSSLSMAVIPGGDELIVKAGSRVRILARDMSSGASFEVPSGYGDFAASEQFLYMATGDRLCCYFDGKLLTIIKDEQSATVWGTSSDRLLVSVWGTFLLFLPPYA